MTALGWAVLALDVAILVALIAARRALITAREAARTPPERRCPVCTGVMPPGECSFEAVPVFTEHGFQGEGRLICMACAKAGAGRQYRELCEERTRQVLQELRDLGFVDVDELDEGEEWKR